MHVAMEYKYMLPLRNRITLTVVIFTHSRGCRLLRAHYWAVSAFAPELLFSHLFKLNSIIILRWYTFEYFFSHIWILSCWMHKQKSVGVSLVYNFSYILHCYCTSQGACATLIVPCCKLSVCSKRCAEVSKILFSHAMQLLMWLT